jgi:glycosyltransferase involved in cell wall biosynthesis
MSEGMLRRITALILTFNEEANIRRTLGALSWALDVVVVDSGSTDRTLAILREFPKVRVFQRTFDTHAAQWSYALAATGIRTEWVLALDADFVLSPELVRELAALTPSDDVSGYRASFIYCVDGVPLRGGIYPPVTVLYRAMRARYVQDGHTQRVVVPGDIASLAAPILHDDRKTLAQWFAAQKRYMVLEAEKLRSTPFLQLRLRDRVRLLIVVAPVAMLFYCLFVRGNILSGKAGLVYSLQRAAAEAILSLMLLRAILD